MSMKFIRQPQLANFALLSPGLSSVEI